MKDIEQQQSADEQVYQANKREVEMNVVYSAETEDDAALPTPPQASQDEVVAETFPASDAPATTATEAGAKNSDSIK